MSSYNGNLYVNSRDIAEGLGKRHGDVLRDLGNIFGDADLRCEIIESEYLDIRGKQQKEYLLSKDGFTLYMFNIQGHNDFKMKYINRFNEMEREMWTKKHCIYPICQRIPLEH